MFPAHHLILEKKNHGKPGHCYKHTCLSTCLSVEDASAPGKIHGIEGITIHQDNHQHFGCKVNKWMDIGIPRLPGLSGPEGHSESNRFSECSSRFLETRSSPSASVTSEMCMLITLYLVRMACAWKGKSLF